MLDPQKRRIRNFEDLKVWKRSHLFTLANYATTKGFPKQELYGLVSQIRRSSASIGANLAEGCVRRSDGGMNRFVQMAMCSASEFDYHLRVAAHLKLITPGRYAGLRIELIEIRKMLSALLQSIRKDQETG